MFGGRRYWQGNGGVYKGFCFPWDTWRVCFPATVCWKSFHRVHRQTDTQRQHSRPQAGTRFISQVPKVSLSLLKRKYMKGSFNSFFNLHLNRLINTGKRKKKNPQLYVDICFFLFSVCRTAFSDCAAPEEDLRWSRQEYWYPLPGYR